jgi:hypothetical protein
MFGTATGGTKGLTLPCSPFFHGNPPHVVDVEMYSPLQTASGSLFTPFIALESFSLNFHLTSKPKETYDSEDTMDPLSAE